MKKLFLLTFSLLLGLTTVWAQNALVSEYCAAAFGTGKTACRFTWETLDNGDIQVTLLEPNRTVSAATHFRGNGIKLTQMTVGSEAGSEYFTAVVNASSNVQIFSLKAGKTIPDGTIVSVANAVVEYAVALNDNAWPSYAFSYTYGGVCNSLDAPTNVSVATDGTITFDAVDGADSYVAYVYDGATELFNGEVTSGANLGYQVYVAKTLTVKVIAKAAGMADSDFSDAAIWNAPASPLPASKFCGTAADAVTANNGSCSPLFTINTLTNGNVTIVLTAGEGTEGQTMFRNTGMNGTFKLNGSAADFTAYFDKAKTDDTYTLTLKDASNKPEPGAIISYSGQIEAKSSLHDNDWSNYNLNDYLYGTKCPVENPLYPPTSINVAEDGTITFTAAVDAESYEARVYKDGALKYSQIVTIGGKLNYIPIFSGNYDVKVVSKAAGKPNSDESDAFVWPLTAQTWSVDGNSEYCNKVYNYNSATGFTINWETVNGDVVISISEGNANHTAGTTTFRGNNGMSNANLEKFTVGPMKEPAANYFTRVFPADKRSFTLKLKDGKTLPEGVKIYYNGTIEWFTSENDNAYDNYQMTYTYGSDCSAMAVYAETNDVTKGTAKVEKNGSVVEYITSGDEVTFTATAKDGCHFVNWTKAGVVVSTSAVYTTTIDETTTLIANFDYTRTAHCHEAMTVGGKTVYMTIGETETEGVYTIRWAGSASAPFTGIHSANYVINQVKTNIDYPNPEAGDALKKKEGQDIHFDQARWQYNAYGYGEAYITFELAAGKTIDDIYVWTRALTMDLADGTTLTMPVFFEDANRHNIDWHNTCSDDAAPVFATGEPKATALDATTIEVEMQATDNWEGMITYTVSYTGMAGEPVVLTGASGEKKTTSFTGLAQQSYTFSVKASDGKNEDIKTVSASPAADATAPTNVAISAKAITDHMVKLTVSANEDFAGDITFAVAATPAATIANVTSTPGEPKSFYVEGLTAGTEYTFALKATNVAGLSADAATPAVVSTFAANIARDKEAHAGHNDADAGRVTDGNLGNRWETNGGTHPDNDWIYIDLGAVYDIASAMIKWENARAAHYSFQVSNDKENWTTVLTCNELPVVDELVPYLDFTNAQGRYIKVKADSRDGGFNNLGYGISIYEFEVYGALATDVTAPANLTIAAEGATESTILVTMSAKDDFNGILTYEIYCDGTKVGETTKQAGEQTTYTVTGLEIQDYAIYYTVKDAAGNSATSETKTARPFVDTEAPVIASVTVGEVTYQSIELHLLATDNAHGEITYVISANGTELATVTGMHNVEKVTVISGLNYLTEYNFSVVAKDAALNASAANTSAVATTVAPYWPIVAAPAPTAVFYATDVMSVYSDAYETALRQDFGKHSWENIDYEARDVNGDNYLFYSVNSSNVHNAAWGSNADNGDALLAKDGFTDGENHGLDLRRMEYMHIDIWSQVAVNNVSIRLRDAELAKVNLDGNGWNSFDLPLANHSAADQLNNVRWMKFMSFTGVDHFAIDNVYFWKNKTVLSLDEASDDASALQAADGGMADVTINRSLAAGESWKTLCLPFSMTAEQIAATFGDCEIRELAEAHWKTVDVEMYIRFDRVNAIEAGKPYLIRLNENVTNIAADGVVIDADLKENKLPGFISMSGTYVSETMNADDYFLATDNYLYRAGAQATIPTLPAFRCYFRFETASGVAPRARAIFNTQVTTDVENVLTDEQVQKYIKDGSLFILRGGRLYDANGRLVK